MLLEDEVVIKCRQADANLVKSCLPDAEKQYQQVINKETGVTKSVKLSVDTAFLPQACLGGVVLACQSGTISIDNTIDARLKLVLEQDKPMIRSLLFPVK
eukprot:gnl/TRDRNA2_/TRDRNA2_81093_c0_seq1.p3 gnl/TRDRNA2_/TRDRNA2_81093_c0~~gnl/TRDRNA2_/TRDRNA2_81093_c0_seq1.p3  ORF type:complete len:100 (+),score=31.82 gnl/TRDRNA2_/TRDRNA2_81093_c0_seq1:2-301(+)